MIWIRQTQFTRKLCVEGQTEWVRCRRRRGRKSAIPARRRDCAPRARGQSGPVDRWAIKVNAAAAERIRGRDAARTEGIGACRGPAEPTVEYS